MHVEELLEMHPYEKETLESLQQGFSFSQLGFCYDTAYVYCLAQENALFIV